MLVTKTIICHYCERLVFSIVLRCGQIWECSQKYERSLGSTSGDLCFCSAGMWSRCASVPPRLKLALILQNRASLERSLQQRLQTLVFVRMQLVPKKSTLQQGLSLTEQIQLANGMRQPAISKEGKPGTQWGGEGR